MSDPRNVAHDKKVRNDKQHEADKNADIAKDSAANVDGDGHYEHHAEHKPAGQPGKKPAADEKTGELVDADPDSSSS